MDKLIQYIIVRGDLAKALSWPAGAVIAQCCHATTAVGHMYRDDPETQQYYADLDNMHKVVLEAADEATLKALETVLIQNSIEHKIWIEQPEKIPTCIAIKPCRKDRVFSHVKKLKLYK